MAKPATSAERKQKKKQPLEAGATSSDTTPVSTSASASSAREERHSRRQGQIQPPGDTYTAAPANPAPAVPAHVPAPIDNPVVYVAPGDIEGPSIHHHRYVLTTVLEWFLRTLFDMTRFFVLMLKYPAILLVACYVILLSLGYVLDTASETLAPVCGVFPGFYPCRVTAAANAVSMTFGNIGRKRPVDIRRVDFPGLMALQSRTLDQLLTHSAAGTHLALGVKHAELAIKDLGIIVIASNLTSREFLANSLEEFAEDAKATSRGLQQLSAKLHGATDRILAFDEYALRTIASAQASGDNFKETAEDMFRSSMSVLSSEVARVILEANAIAGRLNALEEKLYSIRVLCEAEMNVTKAALGELLSRLWTLLGGNRTQLQALSNQAEILANVEWYRTLSVAHVVATTETLFSVEAELSELRDHLSAPELMGDIVPLEVQIASIERSARRITDAKLKIQGDFGRSIEDGYGARVEWLIGAKDSLESGP